MYISCHLWTLEHYIAQTSYAIHNISERKHKVLVQYMPLEHMWWLHPAKSPFRTSIYRFDTLNRPSPTAVLPARRTAGRPTWAQISSCCGLFWWDGCASLHRNSNSHGSSDLLETDHRYFHRCSAGQGFPESQCALWDWNPFGTEEQEYVDDDTQTDNRRTIHFTCYAL